jgi:dTDP-4-dehydrorhamnose 3,5-epimerase-like enzyme
VSYRHRLQAEKRNIYVSERGYFTEWYSRNKFSLKYNLNQSFAPYTYIELRYQIHDQRKLESESQLHRVRYATGVDYKIDNKNTFGIYYLIQREWNVLTPNNLYILGLEYSLTL